MGDRQCRICGDELPPRQKGKSGRQKLYCQLCNTHKPLVRINKCAFCDVEIVQKRGGRTQKYCVSCKHKRFWKQPKPCIICGGVVMEGNGVKVCSDECDQIRRKQYSERSQAKMQSFPHVCAECGSWFHGLKNTKTCSSQCTGLQKCRKEGLTPRKERRCKCLRCGKEYQPKDRLRITCCSRACWYRLVRSKSKAFNRGKVKETKPVISRTCVVCNGLFTATQRALLCSEECRKKYTSKKGREREVAASNKSYACIVCDVLFSVEYGDKNRSFCSLECKKERQRQAKRDVGHGNNRKRARKYGGTYEPINREKIFERDGYRCQICGKKTRRRKDGKVDNRHPSLDHIVPLSLGGSHTKENVQCACFRCNSIKRHTGKGDQMLLYG